MCPVYIKPCQYSYYACILFLFSVMAKPIFRMNINSNQKSIEPKKFLGIVPARYVHHSNRLLRSPPEIPAHPTQKPHWLEASDEEQEDQANEEEEPQPQPQAPIEVAEPKEDRRLARLRALKGKTVDRSAALGQCPVYPEKLNPNVEFDMNTSFCCHSMS